MALPSRGPKIEKIPTFEGKGVREYQDFKTRLEIAFRLDPNAFIVEDQKIAYTLQYLQVTLRQLWLQQEMDRGSDGIALTWHDIMTFLLNQLQSLINRELSVTMLYQKAIQKDSQSVNEFAAYLASLENQISPPYEQKHLIMHLYSKLRPELRTAISNYSEFPSTRQEMVERAATLEDNLRRASGTTATRPRGERAALPSRAVGRTAYTTPYRRPSASATPSYPQPRPGSCNYCHKPGHWEKDCRRKQSDAATGVNRISTSKNGRA